MNDYSDDIRMGIYKPQIQNVAAVAVIFASDVLYMGSCARCFIETGTWLRENTGTPNRLQSL
jgi:hypothetical protein